MPSYQSPAKGLSFLELVAVVGVAMLAASWALPRLLGSRVAVNESSALSDVGFIVAAENTYRAAYPQIGYADRLEKLAWRGIGPAVPPPTWPASSIPD
jgi:type II secretory pathway pseudopilin PulG